MRARGTLRYADIPLSKRSPEAMTRKILAAVFSIAATLSLVETADAAITTKRTRFFFCNASGAKVSTTNQANAVDAAGFVYIGSRTDPNGSCARKT
jgi:hypothetical protein